MDAQDTRTAGEAALRRGGEAWVEWMRSKLSRGWRRADLVREMLRAGWSAQEAELSLETMLRRLGRGLQGPDFRPGDANYHSARRVARRSSLRTSMGRGGPSVQRCPAAPRW